MTIIKNFYPRRALSANTPNLAAGWTFEEGELGAFNRYLNHAASGAPYDLLPTAAIGVGRIGQGGGLYSVDDPNSSFTCVPVIPVTPATSAYVMEFEVEANPSVLRYLLVNGSVSGAEVRISAAGIISISFDRVTMSSTAAAFGNGKGPMRVAGLFDGANQHLVINGRLIDSDAVVPAAQVGFFAVGEHTTIRRAEIYGAIRSLAEERASYVREFARKVVWQWKPLEEGEGPAGGILTGAVGPDWTCPLGAKTMQFVWRPDLSDPNGGRLTLTNSVVDTARIDFEIGPQPVFGSWLIEYTVRDPATDRLRVALNSIRGQDFTAAGSNAYWLEMYNNGGGWWRTSLYLANGAQIDGADSFLTDVVAGTRMKCLLTHHPDGSWQVYGYNHNTRTWGWTAATPVDVNVLTTSCVTISPRGCYVERITRYQGEMTPHELEVQTP